MMVSRDQQRKILTSMPKSLEDVFRDLLGSIIDEEERNNSLSLFLLILCVKTPMSLEEVGIALAFTKLYRSFEEYETSEDFVAPEQLRKLITKRSRGLIEVSASPSNSVANGIVQFIHASVKIILLGSNTLLIPHVSKRDQVMAIAHDQIIRSCFNFVRVKYFGSYGSWSTFSLATYGAEFGFQHVDEAEKAGMSQWSAMRSLLEDDTGVCHCEKDNEDRLWVSGISSRHWGNVRQHHEAALECVLQAAERVSLDQRYHADAYTAATNAHHPGCRELIRTAALRQCCCSSQLAMNPVEFITDSGVGGICFVAHAEELLADAITRIEDWEDIECPICLDIVEHPIIFNSCGHALCHICFYRMDDDVQEGTADCLRCPHCRARIDTKKISERTHHIFGLQHFAYRS